MKITDKEKDLIIRSLNYQADQMSKLCIECNAGDSEWDRVSELTNLAQYIRMTLIDENYER